MNNVVGMDGRSLKWAYDSHNLSLHYYWGIRMGEGGEAGAICSFLQVEVDKNSLSYYLNLLKTHKEDKAQSAKILCNVIQKRGKSKQKC